MGVKLERIVKPYYDWLHEGKIMARKCTKCGAVEWPPLLGCNTCGSPDMEWIEMSGKGQMVQMVMPAPITRKPEMNDIKPKNKQNLNSIIKYEKDFISRRYGDSFSCC